MLKIKIPKSVKWLFALSCLVVIGFILVLDNTIRSTFSERSWSIPSTVYARSLEIYIGAPIKQEDLRLELQQLGYHFVTSLTGPRQVIFQQDSIEIYSQGFQFSDELTSAQKIKISIEDNKVILR